MTEFFKEVSWPFPSCPGHWPLTEAMVDTITTVLGLDGASVVAAAVELLADEAC